MVSGVTAPGEPVAAAPVAAIVPRGRVAVVDIGSNTVRLVVYDAPTRLPIPVFNERAHCALGRSMAKTGRLDPDGVDEALRALARFARLADAMGVERMQLVATAAVRDASDGPEFVERIEQSIGHAVHVVSGAEEARLAAVGLMSGVPKADGVLGDLGGGSLDLVGLDKGSIGAFASLPLGHLRLAEESDGDPQKARALLAKRLDATPWLGELEGRSFYAVGGSWRALARIFIDQTHYPLHVLDNYTIGFFDALRLADLIARLSTSTLERLPSIARRRLETLPYAAAALAAVLEAVRPRDVVFSGFGMREGQMLELLPAALWHQDPLIAACEQQAERTGRFAVPAGTEMLDWMTPLFADETEADRRLRLATCLLSDIGWSEHPDYRALHAFHRVLRVPYAGLTHPDRVRLAVAVLVRYGGDPDDPMVAPVHNLLNDDHGAHARVCGLALRLAHTLTGSVPGLLSRTRLATDDKRLLLSFEGDGAVFLSETAEQRFRNLARALDLKPKIA